MIKSNIRIFTKEVLISFVCFFIAFIFSIHGNSQNSSNSNSIKIGFLIPSENSIEAKLGAQLAIDEINNRGGILGKKIELVIRSLEGPWGQGSKQAVDLIFNEKTFAIVGAINGRNAHLVEQACAKTGTVFLSAWTSDPTLSQAYVPWYFNCVPNDFQQAKGMLKSLKEINGIVNIAIITEDNYDSKMALKSFKSITENSNDFIFKEFLVNSKAPNFNKLLSKINNYSFDGMVLFGQGTILKLLDEMKGRNVKTPLFSSLSLQGETLPKSLNILEVSNNLYTVYWQGSNWGSYKNKYQTTFNETPTASSAYSYDAIHVLLKAMNQCKLDSEKLSTTLKNIQYKGTTGDVSFDVNGNRIGDVVFGKM